MRDLAKATLTANHGFITFRVQKDLYPNPKYNYDLMQKVNYFSQLKFK